MPDFFNEDMAKRYDERNSKLAAISDNLHFLIRLVLADLPSRARILCVGDPSREMLEMCRARLAQEGVGERCELIHGYVQDTPEAPAFDAVLSVLVAHFIARAERRAFYANVFQRLKPEGCFVSAEISTDFSAPEFPAMLKNWEQIQALMGAPPESLRNLDDTLRNALSVLSPSETVVLWRESGFSMPVQFFQSFMIHGWYARKP